MAVPLNLTNANEGLILFYSETCGYCKQVLQVIEENNLEEILDLEMIEANEEGFKEIFAVALKDCGRDPDRGGYPTLYHNGNCSIGATNSIETLLELADATKTGESNQEDVLGDDTNLTDEKNEEEEVEEERTLEEITHQEDERIEPVPRPFTHILMIIIGPALLIALGYYMIKKLNL